jgi:Carboxypeptidase regulatory-like domain
MLSMRSVILLLALALPFLGADMTKLTIEVKTKSGKPIDHASVIVKFVQGRSVAKFGKKIRTEWEQQTNEEGVAKIPSLPQGTILVQVIAKNFQTFGQNFEVNEAEKTLAITLNPPQAQYTAH